MKYRAYNLYIGDFIQLPNGAKGKIVERAEFPANTIRFLIELKHSQVVVPHYFGYDSELVNLNMGGW